MRRTEQILEHHTYRTCLQEINRLEAERIFCGHDMTHLLDVARLAYIFNLEEQLGIDRERVYATALLHDIGRHIQYQDGTPHQEAGLPIAAQILCDCGFDETERNDILMAIARHRDALVRTEANLAGIIYRADKMSRSCFGCPALNECNWDDEQKNLTIRY